MAETTMCEVVQRLRAENCRAVLELRELQYALEDVLENVEQVASASEEIQRALRDMGAPLSARTERLSTQATQIVLAFRAVRVAVLGWNIAGTSGSTLHRTAMRDVVERLRADGNAAMGELRAFDSSFDQLLEDLGLLALASGEFHVAARSAGEPDSIQGYRRVRRLRGRAGQLSTRAMETLFQVRKLRTDVARWNIMGTDGGTNGPNVNERSNQSTPRDSDPQLRSTTDE